MIKKKHVFLAFSCTFLLSALLLSACQDDTSDDSGGGGDTSSAGDDDASSGGTGPGGSGSGGTASGGAPSGGTSSGGTGPGGGDNEDDEIDFDDGEEIGGDDDGLGGAGGASEPETGGTGGGAPVVPVSSSIKASITKQLTPLDLNDPFLIEVGTLTYYPVTLENPEVDVPDGWVLSRVESVGSDCPRLQSGVQRCLQFWQAYLYPAKGVCQLNQAELVWTWDATCALGADCSVMPTNLPDPVTFTTKHTSEYFCEVDIDFDPFLPKSAIIMPTTGTDPVSIRYFTSLADPYRFTAKGAAVPAGMSLVSFSQQNVACGDSNFPNGCRQWWDLVVDPGESCTVSGNYTVQFDVGCTSGGDCDPNVTEYTHQFSLVDRRNLCD